MEGLEWQLQRPVWEERGSSTGTNEHSDPNRQRRTIYMSRYTTRMLITYDFESGFEKSIPVDL